MSTTVDERVVSMKFDNKDFEKNVSTTMSTLDKFKDKLKFDGATKGLESINSASNKCDLSGMQGAISTVQSKFSALEVVGITTIANITNSAVNMGKQMISSFTLQPITSGFSEYETKMNAIQTVLSNTASKGTTLTDVTETLNQLNQYANKTIYNFAEMARNVGTFTAAGVGLKESAAAIQGIGNLAAASGSSSEQASTAMYQLSQALAAGTVKLMDWNSVVNAGMGGEKFQEALKQTAREQGIAVDTMIKKQGSFRESLQEGWLSADVLNTTLNKFTVDGATNYANAMMKSGKYTQEQADALVAEAHNMEDAATKVKTFTQLMDTLKESAQAGWAKTWELIIGNFDQAKDLFSDASELFGGMIQSSADARNALLADTLNSKWDTFVGKAKLAGISTDELSEKIKETAKEHNIDIDSMIANYGSLAKAIDAGKLPAEVFIEALQKIAGVTSETVDQTSDLTSKLSSFQSVVDEVWKGTYDNGEARIKALTDAGYDYASVQDLVNKTVDGHRITLEELSQSQLESVAMTQKMSDAQLASIGFTSDQVSSLRELAKQAEETGTPINDLIQQMTKPSGRVLMIDTIKNSIQAIVKPLVAVKKAWDNTFSVNSGDLYNVIKVLHDLSEKLVLTDSASDKLTRTFSGLFSIVKILSDIVGGGLTLGFKILSPILGTTSFSILDVTAAVGDCITNFRLIIEDNKLVAVGFKKIGDFAYASISQIREWINEFEKIPAVQKVIEDFKNKLDDFNKVGINIVEGLKNGIMDSSTTIPDLLEKLGFDLVQAIKKVLGIHSPSTVMYEVGKFIIEGLLNGLKDNADVVLDAAKDIGNKIQDVIKNIPWNTVIAGAITVGSLSVARNFSEAFLSFSKPAEGLGEIFESTAGVVSKFGGVLKSFSKDLNAYAFSIRANSIKTLAEALLMLVGAIAVLTLLDQSKVNNAVIVIIELATVLTGLALVADKLMQSSDSFSKGAFDAVKLGVMLAALSVSLLIMAKVVKIVGEMNPDQAAQGFGGIILMVVAIGAVTLAMGTVTGKDQEKSIAKFSGMMIKLGVALALMAVTVKILGSMPVTEVIQGEVAILALVGMMALLALATKLDTGGTIDKFGVMMTKLGVSLLLMSVAIKILGGMSITEIVKGEGAILGMVGIMTLLVLVSKLGGSGSQMLGLGKMLTSMTSSLLIMSVVIKILGGMNIGDIIKGEAALLGLTGILTLMIIMVKSFEKDAPKVALTLLTLSVSIGILSTCSVMLSLISIPGLAKGVIAIGFLSVIMDGLILATSRARKVQGTVIAIAVAIGVLSVALVALSFIDPTKLAGATLALSTVLGMFALVIKSSGSIHGGMAELIVMTVAIGELAGIIMLLSTLPMDSVMVIAGSLSVLLSSLSIAMLVIGNTKISIKNALVNIGIMMLVLGSLTGVVALLSALPMDSALKSVESLSILLGVMMISLGLMSIMGTVSPSALLAMGIMTAIVAVLAVILYELKDLPVDTTIGIAESLSLLIISLSASCLLLGAVGLLGPAAFIGIAALATLIATMGAIIVGLGALNEKFPQLSEFVDKGLPLLSAIGSGIGLFLGNIAGGFISGVGDGIANLGTDLSVFMTNLGPFLDGAKNIDASIVGNVKSLAEVILILTAVDVINGLTSWLTGNKSMDDFSSQLVPFGQAMADFSDTVKGKIDDDAVTSASNAGKALAEMVKTLPSSGGWAGTILGDKDLNELSSKLTPFGHAIVDFSAIVKGNIDDDAVTSAANSGQTLAQLASSLPDSGGWRDTILGSNDLDTFGVKLVSFGHAIVDFSSIVKDNIDEAAVSAAANAGTTLSTLASSLPNTGGLVSYFTGDNNFDTFSVNIVKFGIAISDFSDKVKGSIDEAAVSAAANAGLALSNMASVLPKTGGLFAFFTGNNGLDDFAKKVPILGDGISAFSDKVKNINSDNVRIAVDCAIDIVNLFKDLTGFDSEGPSEFVNGLKTISKASLDGFVGTFTDGVGRINDAASLIMNTMHDSIENGRPNTRAAITDVMQEIVTIINQWSPDSYSSGSNMVNSIANSIEDGRPNTRSAITDVLQEIVTIINQWNPDMYNASSGIGNETKDAIEDGRPNTRAAITDVLQEIVTIINQWNPDMYDAGSYLIEGFANGLADHMDIVEDQARRMARVAYNSAMDEMDAHSPSRVFTKAGGYAPMGFANGIKNLTGLVKVASENMVNTAISTTKGTVDKIATMISTSDAIDLTPRISPVVDLSGISGLSDFNINKLKLNSSVDVSISKPISAISDIITSSNEALLESNKQVLSSIKDLHATMNDIANSETPEIAMYMDKNKVASSLATPMNKQLNILAKRGM